MENKLPEGWEWKKLENLYNDGKLVLQNGFACGKNNQNGLGLPQLRPMNASSNGKIDLTQVKFVEIAKDTSRYLLQQGDVIFNNTNSQELVGKTAVWDEELQESVLSNHMTIIRLSEDSGVFFRYLAKYLHSLWVKRYFEKTCTNHINQSSVGINRLKEIEFPLPPLETQQKIVSILEKAEETKKLRAQADELTQKLLQSVFLEMFGDPVTNPKNWEEIKLKDVSEIVSGVTKGRKLSGKSTVFVPYLRVANVQDGYLNLTEIKDIEVLPSDVEKYALQEGDILLTEGGDPDKLGRGAVWNGQIPTCIHQNHIFRVRVNRECLVPEYLSMLIGSAHGKMYFLKSAKQTTGIASINSTQLKNFPALIAPLDLQLKFAEMVHQIEKTTESQQQSSFMINNLFDALMQKAFTGELVA